MNEPFGDYLNLGALYVGNDFPGCPGYDRLTTGIYHLKVRKDLKLIAVDSEEREFVIGYYRKTSASIIQHYPIGKKGVPIMYSSRSGRLGRMRSF